MFRSAQHHNFDVSWLPSVTGELHCFRYPSVAHIEAALHAEPDRMRGAKMAQDAAKGGRARAQKIRDEKHAAWRARATDLWKEDRGRSRTRVADIIHCELRDSKSPRQAEVRTIRAAIADLHPYKGKLAK